MPRPFAPRNIRVAYSPDADDAFMFWGLDSGRVEVEGLEVVRERADIETLNRRALAGELDVTAISFAAWPRLAEHYDLLTVGSSFGIGVGPKLVSRGPMAPSDLAGARVAVPGRLTTAALVTSMIAPDAELVPVQFEAVADAVLSGETDAGVLIHEAQLTYESEGLTLVLDLGEWWFAEANGLPLPLGANAIRRDLPDGVVAGFKAALRQSIQLARESFDEALAEALKYGRGLDPEIGARYVGMYVNELTLDPGARGRLAVDELLARGATMGLLPDVTARWA